METKNLLIGGLIGAGAIYFLPSILGNEEETGTSFGGGGFVGDTSEAGRGATSGNEAPSNSTGLGEGVTIINNYYPSQDLQGQTKKEINTNVPNSSNLSSTGSFGAITNTSGKVTGYDTGSQSVAISSPLGFAPIVSSSGKVTGYDTGSQSVALPVSSSKKQSSIMTGGVISSITSRKSGGTKIGNFLRGIF